MRKITRGFRRLESSIDLILGSPYVRAQETAQILSKALGLGHDSLLSTDNLSPVGHIDRLVEEIHDRYDAMQRIALVGHEPTLSRLISMLVSGDPGLSITMKKGGVCRLSIETLKYGRCATLDWLLYPAQLARIGR